MHELLTPLYSGWIHLVSRQHRRISCFTKIRPFVQTDVELAAMCSTGTRAEDSLATAECDTTIFRISLEETYLVRKADVIKASELVLCCSER
jgi:hypothetical protein